MKIHVFLWKDLPRRKLDFIWFSFLTSLSFIEVYVLVIVMCVLCYLFHRENLS